MNDALPHLKPLQYKRQDGRRQRRAIDGVIAARQQPSLTPTTLKRPVRPLAEPQQPVSQPAAARSKPQLLDPRASHSNSRQRASSPPKSQPVKPNTPKPSKRRRWQQTLQPFVIIFGAMGLGFVAQSPILGEIVIVLYAAWAIIRKVPSRTTFLLAFLLSLCIMVLLVVKSNNTTAATLAIYLFLLLIVGTVQLGLELRKTA